MAIKTIKKNDIIWHYITDSSQAEFKFLRDNFKFHHLDLKDCAGEVQRSKVDIYKNYIFIVLQLPIYNREKKTVLVEQLFIFIGKNYLVTMSKSKLKFLNNIFYKIAGNQKLQESIFIHGNVYLLHQILDYVLRQRWGMIDDLHNELVSIEEKAEKGSDKKLVFIIAVLRRLILQFKAILDPQRLVANSLSHLDVSFLDKEALIYFDDLDDFIEKIYFSLESYRDRVLSLQEINESLISYRTNKVMGILTVFSVALLPLTFLTGLYGMNIPLPFVDEPGVVWLIFIGLASLIGFTFFYLKKKGWI